jgi:transmembrane sensor
MERDPKNFKELFQLYLSNQCSPQQMKELFDFIKKNSADRLLLKELNHEFETAFKDEDFQEKPDSDNVNFQPKNPVIIPLYKRPWVKAAAAVILFIISIGSYWMLSNNNVKQELVKKEAIIKPGALIYPGSNKAVLTLANGQHIILDSTTNGVIALQGNSKIIKDENGLIKYDSAGQHTVNESAFFNTVSTPNGGQYQLILPDGSKVWLNAASSIRFPARFSGSERKVEITGEVYFEVVKNAGMPFKVGVNKEEEIEVLGTHFNVTAYSDESNIRATLLEGSIKIKNREAVNFIKPGQQAILRSNGNTDIVNNVNLDHEIAWKNGLFDFDNDNLPDIMRRLSRWYNVEIIYSGEIPKGHYVGAVRRQANITEVLKMLELAGDVRFSIVGNKILVKEN